MKTAHMKRMAVLAAMAATTSASMRSIEPPMELPMRTPRPGTKRRLGISAAQVKRYAKKARAVRREKQRQRGRR